jgi:hypothetical protein
VDPFALIWVGVVLALAVAFWLIGRYYPGSGLDVIGQKSARELVEEREAAEAEDLDQMLAAHNARRRARGKTEMTVDDLELQVAHDLQDRQRRKRAYAADEELQQLLDATNARRRARGESERTRDDARREFGQ